MANMIRQSSPLRFAFWLVVGSAIAALVGFSCWSLGDIMPTEEDAWTQRGMGLTIALGVPLALVYERLRKGRSRTN